MKIAGYRQTGQPSKLQAITHIWAFRPGYHPDTMAGPYCGKWLIFSSQSQVDSLWKCIKQAAEAGQLGDSVKVSSAGLASRSITKEYLICVYTADFRDRADVFRVREALRGIGVTWPITYKSSEEYYLLDQGHSQEEVTAMHPREYYTKYRA